MYSWGRWINSFNEKIGFALEGGRKKDQAAGSEDEATYLKAGDDLVAAVGTEQGRDGWIVGK